MNNWRQLFRMAVVVVLCVCVVMCFALAVSYAEEGTMAGCAVCSAMVVVFLACAARMASMIRGEEPTAEPTAEPTQEEGWEHVVTKEEAEAILKELKKYDSKQ